MDLDIFNLHVPDVHVDRSVGVKKPRYSADEGPSLTELSGYNAKRHEFDPEYDNDAEQALAEMEFKETDSETDRELKLRVLRIYLSRFVRSEAFFLFIATFSGLILLLSYVHFISLL
jgi:hypothetical protein